MIPDELFRLLLNRLLALPSDAPAIFGDLCYRLASQWCSVCKVEQTAVALTLAETKDELLRCLERLSKDPTQLCIVSVLNNRFLTYGDDKAYDILMKTWLPLSRALQITTIVISFNMTAHWHAIQQQYQAVRNRNSDANQQPSSK